MIEVIFPVTATKDHKFEMYGVMNVVFFEKQMSSCYRQANACVNFPSNINGPIAVM